MMLLKNKTIGSLWFGHVIKLSLDAGSKLIVVTDGANILLKPIIAPTLNEFDELMKESQKWAKKE